MRDDIRIQLSQKGIIPEDYNYHISDYKTQTSEDSNLTNESNTQEATGSLWDEKSVTVEAWGDGNNSSLSGIVYNNYNLDALAESANMEKSEIISELINAIADENDINNIDIIRVGDEISLVNPYELFEIEYDESLDEYEEIISETPQAIKGAVENLQPITAENTTPDATEATEAATEVTTPDATETTETAPEDTTEPQLGTTVPQNENNVNTETDWYSELLAAEQDLESATSKLRNAKKEKITINESLNRILQGTFINIHDPYERTNKTPKQVLIEELKKQQEIIDSACEEIKNAKERIEEAKKEIERQKRETIANNASKLLETSRKKVSDTLKQQGIKQKSIYLPKNAWCAMYVQYALTSDKNIEVASWYTDFVDKVKRAERCATLFEAANNANVTYSDIGSAKIGDIIFFDWHNKSGSENHVGIVYSNEINETGNRIITTAEGNVGYGGKEVSCLVYYEFDKQGNPISRYTMEDGEKKELAYNNGEFDVKFASTITC